VAFELLNSKVDICFGVYMTLKLKLKILILCAVGCGLSACANKSFETASPSVNDDDIFRPPTPIDDDDDIIVNPVVCPRYDLIVDSVDQQTAHRNFRFNFNSEMKMTATQGEIDVVFQRDSSSVRYTRCSGSFLNTAIMPGLKPLDITQELTKQILISHGKVCATVMPVRYSTIRVIDSATGRNLFDEEIFRQQNGVCEFGYTTEGQELRRQLIDFSRAIVDVKAAACN
jgi:hypothetical protein